jgi:hypothetical protein
MKKRYCLLLYRHVRHSVLNVHTPTDYNSDKLKESFYEALLALSS